MLTEENSTKNCLPMDFTKCRNKLVRYTHDDRWDDDAPAYYEEIVSRQEPCEVTTRGVLTHIKLPRIKATPCQGSSE